MEHNFYCAACDFGTNRKQKYELHLATNKHVRNNSKGSMSLRNPNLLSCTCSKKFSQRSGLHYHRTKGKCVPNEMLDQKIVGSTTIINNNTTNITNVNANHNQTTNNNHFNLKFFLNDTCKDAMNIEDFIKTLEITLQDLENVGKLGYAEGISQIMVKALKKLDIEKRPVHCSDIKRETIYIKDKDSDCWVKEGEERANLKQAVKAVECKNIKQISKWKSAHPASCDNTTKTHDQYMKIVGESMGGATEDEDDKNYSKIIRCIAQNTGLPSKNTT